MGRRRRARGRNAVPAGAVVAGRADAVPSAPPFAVAKVDGQRVLLARLPDGRLRAFPDACPHLAQPLRRAELDGTVLTCRHHRHRYDLADGRCVWPGDELDDDLPVLEAGEVDGVVWVRPVGRT